MLIGHFVCGLLKCRPVLLKNHYHAVRFGCESGSRHLPSSRHVIHYWLQPLRVTPVNRAGFAMTFPEGSGKFAPVAMSRQRERSCEAWCEGMPSLGVDTPAARSTHVRPHATFLSAIGGLPFFLPKKRRQDAGVTVRESWLTAPESIRRCWRPDAAVCPAPPGQRGWPEPGGSPPFAESPA